MKQTPDLEKVQERMKPGVISSYGFLGTDDRKLIDILDEDDKKVTALGLTHQKIADRLQYFYEKAKHATGSWITVDEHFAVYVDDVRGYIPCPFGDPGLYPKNYVIVENKKINERLIFSCLSIHLIREHGFYQGRGSPFRIDPEAAKRILEM